jgi:hypothetical protein
MLFVDELYQKEWLTKNKNNLFSSLDIFYKKENNHDNAATGISPVLESVSWMYTRPTPSCTLGNMCTREEGPRLSIITNKIKRCVKLVPLGCISSEIMTEDILKKIVDQKFNPVQSKMKCSVTYIETGEETEVGVPKKVDKEVCSGYMKDHKAVIKKYPHLAVIDLCENSFDFHLELYDLPFEFIHMEKRWILRGGILGNGSHFTAVARLPTCWMYYNGIPNGHNGIKLRSYPLDRKGSQDAMNSYGLTDVYYELEDLDEKRRFGMEEFDHSTVFEFLGNIPAMNKETKEDVESSSSGEENEFDWSPEKSEDEKEQQSLSDVEHEIDVDDKETVDSSSEMTPVWSSSEDTVKHMDVDQRQKKGWSQRPKGIGKLGPLPKCKGCGLPIGRKKKCLRHHVTKIGHKYPTTNQYHCKIKCLKNAERDALKALTSKHWTDPIVANIVRLVDKRMNLSP